MAVLCVLCISAIGVLIGSAADIEDKDCSAAGEEYSEASLLQALTQRHAEQPPDRDDFCKQGCNHALLNLFRHGEKCWSSLESGEGLSSAGVARSTYLARCMSSNLASRMMPYGPVGAIMSSQTVEALEVFSSPHASVRPVDLVIPLARAADLEVQQPCQKKSHECFARNVKKWLSPYNTVNVAWQHGEIPGLVNAIFGRNTPEIMFPDNRSYFEMWPVSCDYPKWPEPKCLKAYDSSTCFDEVWQINYTIPVDAQSWQNYSLWMPRSIIRLQQGFGGLETSPCDGDLAPHMGDS